jgi:hypothetical protein
MVRNEWRRRSVATANSGGAPVEKGAAPQGDEDVVLEQRKFDAQHMKERREGDGEPFTGDELLQQRHKTEAATLGETEAWAWGKVWTGVKGKERGRHLGILWTMREGRGTRRGVVAGGLAIDVRRAKWRKEQKEGGTTSNKGD